MLLHRTAREFYTLELAATDSNGDPIEDATYEATFDSEDTWIAGDQDGGSGYWQWLVAGTDAPDTPGITPTVLAKSVQPRVRVIDSPEIIVDNTPPIRVAR